MNREEGIALLSKINDLGRKMNELQSDISNSERQEDSNKIDNLLFKLTIVATKRDNLISHYDKFINDNFEELYAGLEINNDQ